VTVTSTNASTAIARRRFLASSLAGSALLSVSRTVRPGDAQPRSTARKVLDRLKGPMASITIPYNKDSSIDHGSLRTWVELMCTNKVPVLFLTYGDSELYNLEPDEIAAVVKTVARTARGRSLIVGGTPKGWTGQTVEFVKRLADVGADAANVHLYSTGNEEVYRALSLVASDTTLPLLAYESKWSTDLVKRIAEIPRMVGMKCHAELYRYYDFIRATRDSDFAVLSAGQMKHFLFGYLVGSTAYLCPLTPGAPQIGRRFYDALVRGDIPAARQVIFDYEEPLIGLTIPLGYPQAYKSELFLAGHYATNLMRPPKKTNTLTQIAPLERFLTRRDLNGRQDGGAP